MSHVLAIRTSGHFVLRTPTLPLDEFRLWTDSIIAAPVTGEGSPAMMSRESWHAARETLRIRLREIAERPEIQQALFIASPSLESALATWRRDPDSKKGLKAERALVRYFGRMCGRPTPFGLFSGCSVGTVDEDNGATEIELRGLRESRTSSRLDFDYLFALTVALQRDEKVCHQLQYVPNPSLRRIGDAWHFTESRVTGEVRSHHLVKVYSDAFLTDAIDHARAGATFPELIGGIRSAAHAGDLSYAETAEYVNELISSGVLMPTLTPLVTGGPALDEIISQLTTTAGGSAAATVLRSVRSALEEIDAHGLGVAPAAYVHLSESLKPLGVDFDIARLYQVDLVKKATKAVVAKPVIDMLIKGITVLCRIAQLREPDELRGFREAFAARYEQAWVPLNEALDEDIGLPFGATATADSSPLLRGLRLGAQRHQDAGRLSSFHALLLKKLIESQNNGREELPLEDSDIPAGANASDTLPDSFDTTAVLIASSMDAVTNGDFKLFIKGGGGPSGARLIGRFCQVDSAFDFATRAHIKDEEALYPDAVFAEIVYLPEGRLGNVLCRPVLRDYEIVCMGRSGAPRERQLPLSDLCVCVTAGTILLYSRSLKRRVIPRLTNAHGYMNPQLPPVYRFLAYLQGQGTGGGVPSFHWGPLEMLDYLPRVTYGSFILAPARWRLSHDEVEQLNKSDPFEGFVATQELRARRRLPRWVSLLEGDNALPVDLDNPLSVDAFLHVIKRAHQAIVTELFPGPDKLCVAGPEGRFCHELLVPFVKEAPRAQVQAAAPAIERAIAAASERVSSQRRSSSPGGEWLYLKIYGGESALDDALVGAIGPLITENAPADRLATWFFLRYADPQPHLRVRFRGAPRWLAGELLPIIHRVLQPLVECGAVWKVQVDSYQREVERYGGTEAMSVAEDVFCADSDAVLEILRQLEGDKGQDSRWRIALLGVHKLFEDCGIVEEERRTIVGRARDAMLAELGAGPDHKKQVADRFRTERTAIEALLDGEVHSDASLNAARAILERRSSRIRRSIQQLETLEQRGALTSPIVEIANAYSHMHINRMMRAAARAHECVLYEFLSRLYRARVLDTSRRADRADLGRV